MISYLILTLKVKEETYPENCIKEKGHETRVPCVVYRLVTYVPGTYLRGEERLSAEAGYPYMWGRQVYIRIDLYMYVFL